MSKHEPFEEEDEEGEVDHGTHTHPHNTVESVDLSVETPRHIFIIKSNINHTSASVLERMRMEIKGIPDEMMEQMQEMINTVLETEKSVENYVSFMVTQDTVSGIVRTYAGQGVRKMKPGGGFKDMADKLKLVFESRSPAEGIDGDDLLDEALTNAKLNEVRVRFDPDWNGEREWSEVFEGPDCVERAQAKCPLFGVMFPRPEKKAPATPTESPVYIMTPARRKLLVEKWGEAAVKDLEKRQEEMRKKKN